MPHLVRVVLFAAPLCACTVTDYRFFEEPASVGGACAECGSGGDTVAGAPSASGGGSPSAPADDCRIESNGALAERIRSADSGLCFARGPFQLLAGDPSYLIDLVECSTDVRQIWVITELSPGRIEARNYSVDLNLDVQFAATTTGTPLDLYDPHQFENQRFIVTDQGDGTFKLSPNNAPNQCVSTWTTGLVLRPCDPTFTGQRFERIGCR